MPEGHSPMTAAASDFVLEEALSGLSRDTLERLKAAAEEAQNCERVLRKTSSNVVAEVLRNQGTFYQWNHYPKGDAIDWETHSQYYYHAHPKDERPGEHGHFHTFLRYQGMPGGVEPAKLDHPQKSNKNRIGAHIGAVSMDKKGHAVKVFTTNRWVTDETWYPAGEMMRMIDRFEIDHTFPSWATNRWLSAAIILFSPQIKHLHVQRDAAIAAWQAEHPGEDVFEDRKLEVTSEIDVNVEKQKAAVEKALKG